ncbi:MAG: LysR family transcriptional regulator [Caulobacter sp.]|nr:LysR family transcriptional regulator [Caulobacter sp.]
MFDWDDLRHFLATARAGSTLAAARRLGVNQSTVARRLDALEAAAGVKLFERDRGGAALSEIGADLLAHAEAVETAVAAVEHRLAAQRRGMAGAIRLTSSEALATIGVIPALGEFRRLYPDIQIDLVLTDAFLDIEQGEADIALRASYGLESSNLVSRKIVDDYWGVYCSQAYARTHGAPATYADLAGRAVVDGEGALETLPPMRWLREATGAPSPLRCSTLNNMIISAKAGLGLVALPCGMGDRQDDLIYCQPVADGLQPSIWLLTRQDLRRIPRIRAFIDFIVPHLVIAARQTPDRSPQARRDAVRP